MDRRTRFDSWTRRQRLALVVVTLGVIVWSLVGGLDTHVPRVSEESGRSDVDMYTAIDQRVSDGEDYYAAVSEEQPSRGFATRPIANVRQPTLAWTARLVGGPEHLPVVLAALALVAGMVLIGTLAEVSPGKLSWTGACVLLALGLGVASSPSVAVMHEAWAADLLLLALAFHRRVPWVSMVLVLVASCVRELAAPFLMVMAVRALVLHRNREAVGWAVVTALYAVLYAAHVVTASDRVPPTAETSDGWLALGGPSFVVSAVRFSSVLSYLPAAFAAILVPLALVGWLSRPQDFARVTTLFLGCFAVALCVVGQAFNVYWGLMFSALLLPGLAFAPRALLALSGRGQVRHSAP